MKITVRTLFIILSLWAGVTVATLSAQDAFGKPPVENPGSPGDNCSHGNSNKPCKEDPQPDRGKDCEDHGKARGNEDHCEGTTPDPTTPDTTTPEETTSTPTETTPSQPPSTPTEPSPSPTAPGASQPAPSAPSSPAGAEPVTEEQLEDSLAEQAKSNGAQDAPAPTAAPSDALPYTGLPLWLWVAIGLALVGSGLYLRRGGRGV